MPRRYTAVLRLAAMALFVAPLPAAATIVLTGDQPRTYIFAATGETLPYRVYVPPTWTPGSHRAMVVMLHGGGLDQNAAFDREPADLKGEVFHLADQYGFVLVAPYGYSRSGGYGNVMIFPPPVPGAPTAGMPPPDPALARLSPDEVRRVAALSEADVLAVVDRTASEYGIDRSRIFLMGNSMGGIGTMYLAIHHPDLWRAIAPSEGGLDQRFGDQLGALKVKGVMLVKKDDTPEKTAAAEETARKLTALGIDSQLIVVPGSKHETALYIALPRVFAFFDKWAQP